MVLLNNGILAKTGRAIFQPIIQSGFAGFSVLLLGIVGWTIHVNNQRFDRLLELQEESNQVIERNTNAIAELTRIVHEKL